ncbi:MAG: cob(I)yrinic acid a,c-diamide adenosyltransferase [Candidatus Omnitrophota bacterium]
MKITTKKGDKGATRLCGGRQVSKCDPRIITQGSLDELVSFLGLAKIKASDAAIKAKIGLIQKDLMKINSSISAGSRCKSPAITENDIRMLEQFGDEIEKKSGMPSGFVIPGENESSALLHVSRAIARRAECATVGLSGKTKIPSCTLAYLNRLSDLLFIFALYEAKI